MENFTYYNPVKIVFGKGTISQLGTLIPQGAKVMITYGGGSIKKNNVYDQVVTALKDYDLIEFGGIEPNPSYETCMEAVELCKKNNVDFLLAVGGGSVLDGTKFIAAASRFKGEDSWDILSKCAPVDDAIPLGAILTLPATGSEMNFFSVISKNATKEKLHFGCPSVYPLFSILDPATTYSLPQKYIRNGIVDIFVHVIEQYITYNVHAPLQERYAESILKTLIEISPKLLSNKIDYDTRANFMWCATMALNGLIGCGVPQDWSTHFIGHELTAFFGLDHGESLAVVLPGVWEHQLYNKTDKLSKYGQRIWGLSHSSPIETATIAIYETENFFRSLGMPTMLSEYNITEKDIEKVCERLKNRGSKFGEFGNIGSDQVREILLSRI